MLRSSLQVFRPISSMRATWNAHLAPPPAKRTHSAVLTGAAVLSLSLVSGYHGNGVCVGVAEKRAPRSSVGFSIITPLCRQLVGKLWVAINDETTRGIPYAEGKRRKWKSAESLPLFTVLCLAVSSLQT
jgi:hypothetical protein